MPGGKRPPDPCYAFLKELDVGVGQITRLECIGGFVAAHFYGLGRPTADVDVIKIAPNEAAEKIKGIGRRGGPSAFEEASHLY